MHANSNVWMTSSYWWSKEQPTNTFTIANLRLLVHDLAAGREWGISRTCLLMLSFVKLRKMNILLATPPWTDTHPNKRRCRSLLMLNPSTSGSLKTYFIDTSPKNYNSTSSKPTMSWRILTSSGTSRKTSFMNWESMWKNATCRLARPSIGKVTSLTTFTFLKVETCCSVKTKIRVFKKATSTKSMLSEAPPTLCCSKVEVWSVSMAYW